MRTVKRAFSILELLANESQNGWLSLSQISAKAGLDVSTCFRFLSSLEKIGAVRKDEHSRAYGLGPKVLLFADRFLRNLNLEKGLKPYLERVVADTKETAFYAVKNGNFRITLSFVESPYETMTRVQVGNLVPLTSGCAGRAILAFLDDEEARRVFRSQPVQPLTPWTITKPAEIRKTILEVRAKGYAVSIREKIPDTNAVAAPVFNSNGVTGSIAIVGPAERLTRKNCEKFGPILREIGTRFSQEMGFEPPRRRVLGNR
jgi:DNA-binding IclR family transcriptional regulator